MEKFINYLWDTLIEMEKAGGEEDADKLKIETKVAPIVLTILPIKLDWLFYKNIAVGLNFSGLSFYQLKTEWILEGVESFSKSRWLKNFQVDLTFSFYRR